MTTTTKEKSQPVFKHRLADFEGTVWKNNGEKSDFYSIQVVRNYKNSNGDYRNSGSYKTAEVPIRRIVEDELVKFVEANPLT